MPLSVIGTPGGQAPAPPAWILIPVVGSPQLLFCVVTEAPAPTPSPTGKAVPTSREGPERSEIVERLGLNETAAPPPPLATAAIPPPHVVVAIPTFPSPSKTSSLVQLPPAPAPPAPPFSPTPTTQRPRGSRRSAGLFDAYS